jgi:hypothetical protein
MFAAFENLGNDVDMSIAWESLRENIKISAKESLGYYKLKQHKPWFDEGCSKLLDQSIQAKLKWFQEPSQINEDNLNIVRRKVRRNTRNKKRECLKYKINELLTHSKNRNIRDLYMCVNEFKQDYQPKTNLVNDENGSLSAGCHNLLNSCKNYFCQLLNIVHKVNGVRQLNHQYLNLFLLRLKLLLQCWKGKSRQVLIKFPVELIQARGQTCSETRKLFNSIWSKEELPKNLKDSVILPIYNKGDEAGCSNY